MCNNYEIASNTTLYNEYSIVSRALSCTDQKVFDLSFQTNDIFEGELIKNELKLKWKSEMDTS